MAAEPRYQTRRRTRAAVMDEEEVPDAKHARAVSFLRDEESPPLVASPPFDASPPALTPLVAAAHNLLPAHLVPVFERLASPIYEDESCMCVRFYIDASSRPAMRPLVEQFISVMESDPSCARMCLTTNRCTDTKTGIDDKFWHDDWRYSVEHPESTYLHVILNKQRSAGCRIMGGAVLLYVSSLSEKETSAGIDSP